MKLFGAIALLAFATLPVVSANAQAQVESYPFTSGPVTIQSCSLGASGTTVASNSLEIKYTPNVPGRRLGSITFRVRYNGTIANVTQTGSFPNAVEVDHTFDSAVLDGQPYAGLSPQVCRVLTAVYADGQPAFTAPDYTDPDAGSAPAPSRAAIAPSADSSLADNTPLQTYPFSQQRPVTINSCTVSGTPGSNVNKNSLEIVYFQNVPGRHLTQVTFRVRYDNQAIDVTDKGYFSYGAVIDHKLDSSVIDALPYNGPQPRVCRVIFARFGDGQVMRPPYPY